MNLIYDIKTPELTKYAKGTKNICEYPWRLSERGLNADVQKVKSHSKDAQR